MLKIGHRGAKDHVAENTLESFQKALDFGVDGIELDIHRCASGEMVVIHDETVDRTSNGKGFVTGFSLAELKDLKVEKNFKIPTLQEVLDIVNRKCIVNIELKGKNTAPTTVAIIEKYIATKQWSYDDFLVSSFDWNALLEVRSLNTKIPIGVITKTDIEHAYAFAKYNVAHSIHPFFDLLTKENTLQMQQKGFKIFPWTVNETEAIEKMKSFKVNGIITDFPDRL
jgi:glycerophosphoryl diester phosphodiesterase